MVFKVNNFWLVSWKKGERKWRRFVNIFQDQKQGINNK